MSALSRKLLRNDSGRWAKHLPIALLLLVGLFETIAAQVPPIPYPGQTSQGTKPPPAQPARQEPPNESSSSNNGRSSNVLVTAGEDYRVGAGDTLDIRVADAEELSGTFRVRADGTIKMHFLGRLLVLNKTMDDISKEITDGLRGKYLFEPRVSVDVTELNSKSIYIQGAVNKPGVYQMDGRANLLQLLVMAGGLSQNHASSAFIIRRIKVSEDDVKAQDAALKLENAQAREREKAEKPVDAQESDNPRLQDAEWLSKQYTLIKMNINGLFKGRFDQNMMLEPGDIINIPMTEMFYVSGQVKAPGSFQLKDGTTVRQAVALAQGFTQTASPGKAMIFRENPETGKRMDIPVDLSEIMKGKQEDMTMYPNDVLVVPDSKFKVWTLPLIQIAASSVITALLLNAISY